MEYEQYKKFKKKYNRDFFTAICIKNGYMVGWITQAISPISTHLQERGDIFCRAGKIYKYILVDEDEDGDIRMKSEGDTGYVHSMDWNFFAEFFIKDEGDFIKAKEMQL